MDLALDAMDRSVPEPASLGWLPEARSYTPPGWALAQARTLASIFVVILGLVVLLKALRAVGIERLPHRALTPPPRLLGIGAAAANVTVIGLVLGLSYGAGLLIRDVEGGTMNARDSYLA